MLQITFLSVIFGTTWFPRFREFPNPLIPKLFFEEPESHLFVSGWLFFSFFFLLSSFFSFFSFFSLFPFFFFLPFFHSLFSSFEDVCLFVFLLNFHFTLFVCTLLWLIQSNLSTTATLGTPKKWPLFKGWGIGGRYSQLITIKFWKLGLKLAVVDRWPLFKGGLTGLTVPIFNFLSVCLSPCLPVSLHVCLSVYLLVCHLRLCIGMCVFVCVCLCMLLCVCVCVSVFNCHLKSLQATTQKVFKKSF